MIVIGVAHISLTIIHVSRLRTAPRNSCGTVMLAPDNPDNPNGDAEVKGDAEAKGGAEAQGDADVQPRPSLSPHSAISDERTARTSNISPVERLVPLVSELSTRNASIKAVAGANIAARRLTRACSAAKIDLSSVSPRRKSGEDPEATFQVRLRIASAP